MACDSGLNSLCSHIRVVEEAIHPLTWSAGPGENSAFAEILSGLERVGGQHLTLREAALSGFSVPHVSSRGRWRGTYELRSYETGK